VARSLLFVCLALVTACSDDTRRPVADGGGSDGGGSDASTPRDSSFPDVPPFDAGMCTDVVDVVFVLDVSSSMV
jgi:hypothetical protein